MEKSIVVIAEHFEGEVRSVIYELISCARKIAEFDPSTVRVIVLGAEIEETASRIAGETGLGVTGVENTNLGVYNVELYTSLLEDLLKEISPSYVLAAHTTTGMDFLPGLALRLMGSCISAVEGVSLDEGAVSFVRSFYNGKISGRIIPRSDPVFLTVQAGAFTPFVPEGTARESVELRRVERGMQRSRPLGFRKPPVDSFALTEAEVVVAAGRGIGKKGNLDLIYRLASLFPKSAVGGSRPVCDSGWLDHRQQVGLTGAVVAPMLYVACGISGSAQHLVGMRGAALIVAINTDPDAVIFNLADVAVVEDLTTFIPVLLREASS